MELLRKCKYCGRFLTRGETPQSHIEICGGIDDGEAESMSPENIEDAIEEIEEDDDD